MSEINRVKYNKCPLIEVIFQLRFPTILSINTKQPDAFQERIREQYPFYQEVIEKQNEIVLAADGRPTQVKQNASKNYAFISADSNYKINLTSSFISVSTTAYTQWEDFREHIARIIPIFEDIYKPAFYTRVGLRYIDAITKSALGLEGVQWNELIRPHVLGIMTPEIETGIKSFVSEAEYGNPDGKTITKAHFELVHINENVELSLLIDTDYFSFDITQKADVFNVAELLHENSSNFIGKAITKRLSDAMEPVEI